MGVLQKLTNSLPKRSKSMLEEQVSKDIKIVQDHFDPEFYFMNNRDVRDSGKDPLRHFCEFGWKEMRDPNGSFSTRYYLNSNPDVAAQDINPFVHFLTIGEAEGRSGRIVSDNYEAREIMEAVKPFFDEDYYLSQNRDVREAKVDPLEHFVLYGWMEGRNPSPEFSVSFYLKTYNDIKASGVNPFWHYIVAGRQENRLPMPQAPEKEGASSAEDSKLKYIVDIINAFFDNSYYMEKYPEVAEYEESGIMHFCQIGWREGKDPSAEFSVNGYLEDNPDVAASGVNPLWHYVVAGRDEGRPIISVEMYRNRSARPVIETSIEAIRDHFDSAFYIFKYADVAASGLDPHEHYWNSGWKEGRDPCATFSTGYYLDTNPDVADLGINPFWHYVVAGKREGRVPQHPGGHRIERLRNLDTLEEEARRWARKGQPKRLLGSGELSNLILKARRDGSRELLLSVGHDHYHKVSGGVQLCEHREEAISSTSGRIYLNLHPWSPLPKLAHLEEEDNPIVCLLMNGEDLGYCRMSDLLKSIAIVTPELHQTMVVIHQLLGHAPEHISKLIKATGQSECWLWLHDFLTICPSYTLQRNGVSFCGAPPLESNACSLCRYGEERKTHSARMSAFFDEIDVHVLSPSEVTAATWTARSGLSPASLTVLPHMTLKWAKRTTPPPRAADKITIGFLGTPAPHKGWNVFERLVRTLEKTDEYRFLFLGTSTLPANGIDHIPVHVSAEDPDAMIEAVREEKIDLVLHWASWPETFSLSTFEAYAGGAYVLTNTISGNVAATVDKLKRGAVLKDEAELFAFFESDKVHSMLRAVREDRHRNEVRYQLSRMVHDAIDLSKAEEQQ